MFRKIQTSMAAAFLAAIWATASLAEPGPQLGGKYPKINKQGPHCKLGNFHRRECIAGRIWSIGYHRNANCLESVVSRVATPMPCGGW
jgi:hypothetical protein